MNRYTGVGNAARAILEEAEKIREITPDIKKILGELEENNRRPNLSEIIEEELPKMMMHDPNFFDRYGLDMPVKLDEAMFEMYIEKSGADGVERAIYAAKVLFRHLRYFSVDRPNERKLNKTVIEFKKILDGRYE